MLKRIIKSLFLFTLPLLLITCNQKKDIYKVGLLMDDYVQERWLKDKDLLIKEINKLGGDVLIEVAKGDDEKQYQQAENLIKQGVDVLIIIPVNLETTSRIVEYAHSHDVKVIAYDRLIKNCDLDFYISFDNVQVGILQATTIYERCQKGNYALINGPTEDNNSFLLKLGWLSYLQPLIENNEVNVVYDVFVEKWNASEGYKHMGICMAEQNGNIDAVIAGNDDLASGAIKYYVEKDPTLTKTICFAGQDADLQSCKSIINGLQTMTVYKPLHEIAKTTAKVTYALVNDEKIDWENVTSINNNKKMVPTILISPIAVHKDNIKETVIADEFLMEAQLYE
jgi:D-xylose transport system substrate-binding protein